MTFVFKKNNVLRLVFFVSLFLISVKSVHALNYGGFGARPAFPRDDNPRTQSIFVHSLEPGESIAEAVNVINNTPDTKTVRVYAADSTPSTDGGFACEQLSQTPDEVGSWIVMEKSVVTLESGGSERVYFDITMPPDAEVGEHNGCILIQEEKAKEDGQPGINLSTRLGLRVALTVPGEIIKKLQIGGITSKMNGIGKSILTLNVRNLGNVSIDSQVNIVVSNLFGQEYRRFGGEYTILRGDESIYNFDVPESFWGGFYWARGVVEYDSDNNTGIGEARKGEITRITTDKYLIFIFPTLMGLATELAIIFFTELIIVYFVFDFKRKKWVKETWKKYKIKSGDTIKGVAEDHRIDWKLLAKVNKIKAPYDLRKGESLLVPPK